MAGDGGGWSINTEETLLKIHEVIQIDAHLRCEEEGMAVGIILE